MHEKTDLSVKLNLLLRGYIKSGYTLHHTVADPEGFHRFPLKPPLLDNVYNNNIHLQQRYTATLDSKETSLPCSKFVY